MDNPRNLTHSFRVVSSLLLAGVVADISTTALGIARDPAYEQNPLGAGLIAHGWLVVGAVSLLLVWGSYRLVLYVLPHRPGWGRALTAALAVVCVSRWVAAVTACLWLAGVS